MKNWNEMNYYEQRVVCLQCPYYYGELDDCMVPELLEAGARISDESKACRNLDVLDESYIHCDGRCLNCDYYGTSDCPDRR